MYRPLFSITHWPRPLIAASRGLGRRARPSWPASQEFVSRRSQECVQPPEPADFLLYVSQTLEAEFDGQIAPSDHHCRARRSHARHEHPWELLERRTSLDLEDQPQLRTAVGLKLIQNAFTSDGP